jgi:hypothetical protein
MVGQAMARRYQERSEVVCVAELVEVGRNFHAVPMVVPELQAAPSKSARFESASRSRLSNYSLIVGGACTELVLAACLVHRSFCSPVERHFCGK